MLQRNQKLSISAFIKRTHVVYNPDGLSHFSQKHFIQSPQAVTLEKLAWMTSKGPCQSKLF